MNVGWNRFIVLHHIADASALYSMRFIVVRRQIWRRPTWPPEKLTIENLRFIHGGKTSALFQLACLGGAALAQASAPTIDAVLNYAYFLGLAFQAKDDILDVTSTPEVLGKPTQADTAMTKLTYPTLLGSIGAAQVEAVQLAEIAISELRKVFGPGAEVLEELARYSVNREK